MRIAIIYTGEIRTARKTIPYLKENVLAFNEPKLFCVVQGERQDEIFESIKEYIASFIWFEQDDIWFNIRERLLSTMNISDRWKYYLRNSGSMVEYYQLYLGYLEMCKYEQLHNMKFDYVIRYRTDLLIAKPLDFHWLNLTEEDIKRRIRKIKEKGDKDIIRTFMSSLVNEDLIDNDILEEGILSSLEIDGTTEELVSFLKNYIQNGKYIFSIRKNIFYFLQRKYFFLIPVLGVTYGTLKIRDKQNWFDAESQFENACILSNLDKYDYNTHFECKSLYQYEEEDYFCKQQLKEDISILYILVRK